MILFFLLLLPNKRIPIFNTWGKNYFNIYLFYKIFTIVARIEFFSHKKYSDYIIEYSFLFTLINMFIFGSDFFIKLYYSLFISIYLNLLEFKIKGKIISTAIFVSLIMLLSIKPFSICYNHKKSGMNFFKEKIHFIENSHAQKEDLKESFDNAIRISYIGDLMLSKDQITAAKNNITGKYEFDQMFKYTSTHFKESDFSIGVYNGLSEGNNIIFPNINDSGNISSYLNFPEEFVESVKNAGINMINTAANHLLDQNIEGVIGTLDILDKKNIIHVGSYRNQDEKDKIEIVNLGGIRIAFLAYISELKHYTSEYIYEKYRFTTRIIPKNNNIFYARI